MKLIPLILTIFFPLSTSAQSILPRQIELNVKSESSYAGLSGGPRTKTVCTVRYLITFRGDKIFFETTFVQCGGNASTPIERGQGDIFTLNKTTKENILCEQKRGSTRIACSDGRNSTSFQGNTDPSKSSSIKIKSSKLTGKSLNLSVNSLTSGKGYSSYSKKWTSYSNSRTGREITITFNRGNCRLKAFKDIGGIKGARNKILSSSCKLTIGGS